jgi:hypothetical protein
MSKNVLSLALAVGLLASSATSVSAPICPSGVGQCKSGFVWREARHEDHVCVTSESRRRAQEDAGEQLKRTVPGSDTCVQGFVWRETTPDDHICVTGKTRTESAEENRLAASRVDPSCTARAFCKRDCIDDLVKCKKIPGNSVHQCQVESNECQRRCNDIPQ